MAGLGAAFVVLIGLLTWIMSILARWAVRVAVSAIGPRPGKDSSGSRWLDRGAALFLGGVVAVLIASFGHSSVLEGSFGGSQARSVQALVKS